MRKIAVASAAVVLVTQLGLSISAPAQTVQSTGTLIRVDSATGQITLIHEPIKNLDMDRMTSVFRVRDIEMLRSLQVGDETMFHADRIVGQLTIIKIEKSDDPHHH